MPPLHSAATQASNWLALLVRCADTRQRRRGALRLVVPQPQTPQVAGVCSSQPRDWAFPTALPSRAMLTA